jgi:hypothetical protein
VGITQPAEGLSRTKMPRESFFCLTTSDLGHWSFPSNQMETLALFGFFFFWWNWVGFELRASHSQGLSHTFSSFCSGYFGDEVLQSICPCWPQTSIHLIPAFQVARVTGVSHWCLVGLFGS